MINAFIFCFFSEFLVLLFFSFFNNTYSDVNFLDFSTNTFYFIDTLNNIDVLGQVLYNYFVVCFLLAGFILLISLIGSIVLTINFAGTKKTQQVLRQLSRSETFLSLIKMKVAAR